MRSRDVVGVEGDRQALEAERWLATVEEPEEVMKTVVDGVETAVGFRSETLDEAKQSAGKIAGEISERLLRAHEGADPKGS